MILFGLNKLSFELTKERVENLYFYLNTSTLLTDSFWLMCWCKTYLKPVFNQGPVFIKEVQLFVFFFRLIYYHLPFEKHDFSQRPARQTVPGSPRMIITKVTVLRTKETETVIGYWVLE